MVRARVLAAVAAVAMTATLALVLPMAWASAATCAAAWSSSTAYVGGTTVSHNGRNWTARWWTQNEVPGGSSGVWTDQGTCGPGTPGPTASPTASPTATRTAAPTTAPASPSPTATRSPTASPAPTSTSCTYPTWVSGRSYAAGAIVRYTPNGRLYRARHANPGYDPTVSTWYWEPYSCGAATPTPTGPAPTTSAPTSPNPGGFVVTEAQFQQMFPNRNPFYTYQGLVAALRAYPAFANTGSEAVRRQEAAAFLANVNHETGGLVHIVEQNTANYPHYCDASQPYGCPAGRAAYYGRGPIQLSWNFNYKAAGDALGIDLLRNPNLVQTDAAVAWQTALWYWNTQQGPGTMTPHHAMVNGYGFGETIRSINGALECGGRNPTQVQSRVNAYQRFVQILGTTVGSGSLTC